MKNKLEIKLRQKNIRGFPITFWLVVFEKWTDFNTAWKVSKYGVFSGPYFPAFGLNTERYRVSLRIQSECGKIRTTKKSKLDTFHRVQRLLFVETAVRKIDTQHKCFPVKIAKLLKTPFFIKHL